MSRLWFEVILLILISAVNSRNITREGLSITDIGSTVTLTELQALISQNHRPDWDSCRDALESTIRRIENWDLDAMRMGDSWGKPSSGILEGNFNQYGNFDECLNSRIQVKDVVYKGKYCLLSLKIDVPDRLKDIENLMYSHYTMRKGSKEFNHRLPHFSDFKWGSCIPSVCPSEIVELLNDTSLNVVGETFRLSVRADEQMCYLKDEPRSNMAWIPWLYFGLVFLLVILGTASSMIQIKYPGSTYIECFSLKTNWNKLIEYKTNDFAELNGIRTASAIGLLLSHKNMAMLYNPYVNRTTMTENLGRPWSVIGRTAIIYTDGFILLSGYLSGVSFLKKLQNKGRIDIKESLVSRYWRLVPNLLTVIIACTLALPYLNTGPQWNLVVRKHAQLCEQHWWKNLLFVHNFFGFENMCLTHTHQLGIDFQLFMITPIIVYMLWKWPKVGSITAVTMAILSTIVRYVVTYRNQLSVVIYFGISTTQLLDTANYSYILPYHRLTVYLMGVGVSYFLRNYPQCIFNKVQIALLWMVAATCGILAMFGPFHTSSPDYEYDAHEAAMYNAFSPILWGCFIGWGIIAASYGQAGWLGKLMAWRGFQTFSKLSYSIYLTQFPIFFYNVGIRRHIDNYSPTAMFNFEEYAVVLFFSVMMTLMVEMPMNNARELYIKDPPGSRTQENLTVDGKEHPNRNLLRPLRKNFKQG